MLDKRYIYICALIIDYIVQELKEKGQDSLQHTDVSVHFKIIIMPMQFKTLFLH